MASTREQLIDLLEPVIEDAGYELVELEYTREKNWVLRLYVDHPNQTILPGLGVAPGQGITLDQCAQLSRQLSALLDVEDVVPHSYSLEVSSPGIRRPLRKEKEFARFQGARIRVHTFQPLSPLHHDDVPPRRNFLGQLEQIQDQTICVDVDGLLFEIPLGAIARANLEPDMDALLAAHSASEKTRDD